MTGTPCGQYFVRTHHTYLFVQIQLPFVHDCVIFLCKGVGNFFFLPSSTFSLSLIGGWSSLAQPDIGVHCLLAGNSFPASRGLLKGGGYQVLVRMLCPSVSSPSRPLGESLPASSSFPTQKSLGETPELWALLSRSQQPESWTIMYALTFAWVAGGLAGALNRMLVPWPVASRPTASFCHQPYPALRGR